MKKFRKLLVLSFSALLTVGVIAGCSNEETPSESTSTPTSESLSAAPSTPVDPTDVPSEPEQPSDESEPETPSEPSESEPEVPSEPSESEPEVPSEPSESEPEVPSVSDSEPDQPSESDPSEPEPEVPTYNYAADYKVFFEDSYKDVASQMADFDLPTVQSTFDDNDNPITVNIAWELEVHEGGVEGAIVKGEAANGKQHFTVTYNPEVSNVETSFTITGTITDPNGNEETVTFNWTIPAFEFASFDEFAALAAESSDKVVNVKGKVIAIYKSGLYFADAENDGFYAYSPTGFAAADYKVGDEILVSGTATIYSGQYEFNKGCTVTKLNDAAEDHAPVYTDITETVAAATSNTDATLNQYQNSLVEIKGVTVDTFDTASTSSLYYYFTLGDVRTYLRPYDGWINPDTGANYTLDEINALFTEWNKGYTADLKGLLSIYGGKYYLSLVDNDAITYTSKELADDVKAANAAEIAAGNFKDTYVMGHTFDLPATGQSDAALSYAITSEAAKVEDGKLVVTPLANDTTVSVNITATVNGEVGTYTTDFIVKGTEYETIDVSKAVELCGALDAASKETSTEWYYVTGTVGEIYNTGYCNFYLTTANDPKALTVYGLWTGEDSGENRYGSNREIAEIPVEAGDTVTLYTKLQNYNGTLELVNAMLINVVEPIEAGVALSGTVDGALELTEAGTYEGQFTLAQWGNVKFTYTDAEGNVTVLNHNNTTITGHVREAGAYGADWTANLYHDDAAMEADGLFYCCAGEGYTYFASYDPAANTLTISDVPTVEEPEEPVVPDTPVVEAIAATLDATDLGIENSAAFESTTLNDVVTLTAAQNDGANPAKFYTSGDALRFYGKTSLTISVAEGYKIASIVITTTTDSNALVADNGVLTNATATYDGATVTLTPTDGAADVVITNPNSKGNWRLVAITVNYVPVEEAAA